MAEVLTKLDTIKRMEKEMRDTFKARMLSWILTNKKDITIGTKRYYAGTRKETKCRDRAYTLDQLLQAAGGDVGVVADVLCADPFKPATARLVLSVDEWAKCFNVEAKVKLLDGKPTKEVLDADERFIGDKIQPKELSHEEE